MLEWVVKIISREDVEKKKKDFENKVLEQLIENQKQRLLNHKKKVEETKYFSELTILHYILTGKIKPYGFDKSNITEIFPNKKYQKNPDILMEKNRINYEFEVYQPDEYENKFSKKGGFNIVKTEKIGNNNSLTGTFPDSNIVALRSFLSQKQKQLATFNNPILFIDGGRRLGALQYLLTEKTDIEELDHEWKTQLNMVLEDLDLSKIKGIFIFNSTDCIFNNKEELIPVYISFSTHPIYYQCFRFPSSFTFRTWMIY